MTHLLLNKLSNVCNFPTMYKYLNLIRQLFLIGSNLISFMPFFFLRAKRQTRNTICIIKELAFEKGIHEISSILYAKRTKEKIAQCDKIALNFLLTRKPQFARCNFIQIKILINCDKIKLKFV